MPKINKRLVDGLRPSSTGTDFTTWDSDLKGFGVRMMPSGVASFLVYYRTKGGRQRKLTLGRVGTLTPEQARQLAREKLTEASKGADPSAERHRAKTNMTVADLCDLYIENKSLQWKKTTLDANRSNLNTHVKPLIGKKAVTDLTLEDLDRLQADIARGRTAKPRQGVGGVTTGGKGIAGRTMTVLRAALDFARKRKITTENVAIDLDILKAGKKERFLTIEEIAALGQAMRDAIDAGETEVGVTAIRFLLLTGCRKLEGLALRVDSLERHNRCIRFSDTKTGYQTRPIGLRAFECLDNIVPHRGWVFPSGRGATHFVGLPKVLARLYSRANIKNASIHTIRHTYSTVAVTLGYSELTIAGLLGHSLTSVTARYAHVPEPMLISAAEEVSARIADAIDGN